jgi:hypothetical protein
LKHISEEGIMGEPHWNISEEGIMGKPHWNMFQKKQS